MVPLTSYDTAMLHSHDAVALASNIKHFQVATLTITNTASSFYPRPYPIIGCSLGFTVFYSSIFNDY